MTIQTRREYCGLTPVTLLLDPRQKSPAGWEKPPFLARNGNDHFQHRESTVLPEPRTRDLSSIMALTLAPHPVSGRLLTHDCRVKNGFLASVGCLPYFPHYVLLLPKILVKTTPKMVLTAIR